MGKCASPHTPTEYAKALSSEVIRIRNLRITDSEGDEKVRGIDLSVRAGETLGIVGESGSGKTLTLRSLIGILPSDIRETSDEKVIAGETAMVFQNPLSALDPLCPVRAQLEEVIRIRQRKNKAQAKAAAAELIRRLSLPEELIAHDRYPGELSGGQQQRIVIAIALACRPEILLCDEPTTALDVTVQRQTLELIKELQEELHFAVVFVTHNLAVAAEVCERIAVMKDGQIIEQGSAAEVLGTPQEEYTRKLLAAILPVPEREEAAR